MIVTITASAYSSSRNASPSLRRGFSIGAYGSQIM
jgi:hypothetical protein